MRSPLFAAVCLSLCSSLAFAAEVGDTLKAVELQSSDDTNQVIPDFGKKVIALFYTDADVSDMNDPLADAIKAKEFDQRFYRGLGVANLQDSKAPNFLIRSIVKGKVEKYKSTILLDPNLTLASAWGFGDCNNQSVVVVIGADKKVKYLHKGPVRGAAEIDGVVKLIETLVVEMRGSAEPAATPTPAPTPAGEPAPTP